MPLFPPHKLCFLRRSPRAMVTFGVILGLCQSIQSMAIAQTTSETTTLFNQAEATYQNLTDQTPLNAVSNQIEVNTSKKQIDPFGRIVGCDGKTFDSYDGFTVALYQATGALGTDLGSLVKLPDATAANTVSLGGQNVNPDNLNPFPLSLTENLTPADLRGRFNFILSTDQVTPGTNYILVIQPPPNQFLDARRIRVSIIKFDNVTDNLSYRATSLDGLPLGLNDVVPVGQTLVVPQGTEDTVVVFALPNGSDLPICQSQAIQIQKTADRVTSEPGGFVVYHVSVKNLSTTTIKDVVVSDRLPLGFTLLEKSVQAVIGDKPAPITTTVNGRSISFAFQEGLPGGNPPTNNPLAQIIYATEVTPDAIRGDGRNFAQAAGDRTDNKFAVSDGPAVFEVGIHDGLLSDLGTIIGRVFVDKNFDGEQQYGEPGVPNAVVFMENGNRIVTDKNGLFSVANVLPGWHVGVLDLTSVPGYTYAPNPYVLKSQSQSRAVHLEPGGLVRMNFAVTPVAEEVKK